MTTADRVLVAVGMKSFGSAPATVAEPWRGLLPLFVKVSPMDAERPKRTAPKSIETGVANRHGVTDATSRVGLLGAKRPVPVSEHAHHPTCDSDHQVWNPVAVKVAA